MKKITSLFILIAILASLLSLSSCGEQHERITDENYDAYLNLNIYLSDTKIYEDGNFYELYCIVHVETSSTNPDYIFEYVTLTLSPQHGLFESTSDVRLEIDSYGSAHSSFSYYHARSSKPIFPDDWEFEVTEFGGTVAVPND